MIENGLPCNIRYEKYIELFLVRLEMRTIKSRLSYYKWKVLESGISLDIRDEKYKEWSFL